MKTMPQKESKLVFADDRISPIIQGLCDLLEPLFPKLGIQADADKIPDGKDDSLIPHGNRS